MADPSLFHALRDMVQQGWQYVPPSCVLLKPNKCLDREKGLKAQYWGPSVDKAANEFYWLLREFSYKYMHTRYTIITGPLARAHCHPFSVGIT